MATAKHTTRPSDLPTKRVRAADGTVIQMKVVQADSETFAEDLLAAFRSNVRRILRDRKAERIDGEDAVQG